jgi:large subunit ribosomal protein LX
MSCRVVKRLKVFRVTGEILKPNLKTSFKKEIVAAKPEHATEKVYAELGSKHRVKRFYIKIKAVEEVPPEEIEDPLLRKFVLEEDEVDQQQ